MVSWGGQMYHSSYSNRYSVGAGGARIAGRRARIYTGLVQSDRRAIHLKWSRGFLITLVAGVTVGTMPGADAFVSRNCVGCHNSRSAAAKLNLETLTYDFQNPENQAAWVKVHDRVAKGEMPPAPIPRPDVTSVRQYLGGLRGELTAWGAKVKQERGRAGLRRLNAYEYENAIRDLLAVPWVQVRSKLPQDGEAYRYNKSGGALDVSHVQMARYLGAVDGAMREAMGVELGKQPSTIHRIYARQEPTLLSWRPREGNTRTDRLNFPVLDSQAQPDVRAGRNPVTTAELREREAVGRVSSIFSDAGGFSWSSYRVPTAGRYKVRVKGYSIWVSGGGVDHWNFTGFGAEKIAYLYRPSWHRANPDEVWPGRRNEPIGVYAQSSGQSRPLAEFDFSPEPGVQEVEVVLGLNDVIQTDAMRLFRTRVNGTEEEYVNPLARPDGMPGVAFQWIEVEGPLPEASARSGYELLFGSLPMRKLGGDAAGGVTVQTPAPPPAEGAGGPPFRFRPRTQDVRVEVESKNPRADAERLLRGFLKRTARRPVGEEQFRRLFALYEQQFGLGRGFTRSLLSAYTAVLVSPDFLYVTEAPGKLDDYAVATRLALFLWNSPPDSTLLQLAERKQLSRPEVLRAQTERLLKDRRSRRFVDAFTDYWLDLRKVDDSSPSTTLYNDYELDDPLKLAAVEETRLFVEELFRADLPARNVVASDFTFLNERLARHYGIEGVAGVKMRKVNLPKDSVRGGLMTQASVLKVTANGTTTSPVLRGVWVMERILGFQTAPPPDVPAIEPDIRGAVTIRQQLDKHRADPSCAACHRKIDPPGFALESFDVMGGWRERYRSFAEGTKPEAGIGFSGQAFAFHHGPSVDPAGKLNDGGAFGNVKEFKQLLLGRDEETVARNVVGQLVTYATGAPVGFADRASVDRILEKTRASRFGMRGLIHGIVQSELFLNK